MLQRRQDHDLPQAIVKRGWRYHHLGIPTTVPHVAFEVDDLDAALVGQTLLCEVSSPTEGVKVAMIIDNGAPIELLEFRKPFLKRA